MGQSLLSQADKQLIIGKYNELKQYFPKNENQEGINLIKKAFDLANRAHANKRRKSGEPFITHPLEVALITARDLGLGSKSIVNALLHDVVEDTNISLKTMRKQFGEQSAVVIDGLTKIPDVYDGKNIEIENFKKILLSIPVDIQVILIKLADRLHNMRTMDSMPKKKQHIKAGETLYIYAPLAGKLGLYEIKKELEDLSFKYRYEEEYKQIAKYFQDDHQRCMEIYENIKKELDKTLKNSPYKNYEILPRKKSHYSVWEKLKEENIKFEEYRNYFAVRVIFDAIEEIPERTQCYDIYTRFSEIHYCKDLQDRALDKKNPYEAIHFSIMGPHNDWIEIQLLTKRMQEISYRGYASEEKYKELSQYKESRTWIETIKEHLKGPEANAMVLFEDIRQSIFSGEIFVFTPKGEVRVMPKGSTVLDFAFDLHTDLGYHCISAEVNHKPQGKRYILQNADMVNIITSPNQTPKEDWIDIVVTPRAKEKLRFFFKDIRLEYIKLGKNILEGYLSEFKMLHNAEIYKKILSALYFKSKDELLYRIGMGKIDKQTIAKIFHLKSVTRLVDYPVIAANKLFDIFMPNRQHETETEDENTAILLEGSDYTMANCCKPIPGDSVTGLKNKDGSLSVHKTNCSRAISLIAQGGTEIKINWTTSAKESYAVRIKLSGYDRVRLVSNIVNLISEQLSINIKALNFNTKDDEFEGSIDLYVYDLSHLTSLIEKLRKIHGILKIEREDAIS